MSPQKGGGFGASSKKESKRRLSPPRNQPSKEGGPVTKF